MTLLGNQNLAQMIWENIVQSILFDSVKHFIVSYASFS